MKMHYKVLPLALLSLVFSCKDFVSKDDVSPNEPSTATLNTLLPVVEVSLFATYTGSMARNTSMFIQHTAGVSNQSNDYNRYVLTESDVSNDWQTIYNAGLVNCNELISKAGTRNPRYAGIAKISKAMLLGIATDFWGDVPNREAGLGAANLAPKYDAQELVISDIQKLLSEAVTDLSKPASANANVPGSDDFMLAGDPDSWIKTAYMLKARYALRVSLRDGAAYTKALAMVDSVELYREADDLYAVFSSKGNELNQWYAFDFARKNYMKMGATLVDTLRSMGDPRLSRYCAEDGAGGYSGAPNGATGSQYSYVGAVYAGRDSKLPLVCYFETKFIEAEAAMKTGDVSRGKAAYEKAVRAQLASINVPEAEIDFYMTGAGSLPAKSSTDEMTNYVLFQKWIAMFTQPESWSDWRRTGVPGLTPNPQGVLNQIPVRYPTEQRERNNNPNATVTSNLTTPVWWDGN